MWEMVFCYQNCSDLLWEKNCSSDREKLFEIRGWRPRICKFFEITRTIYSNSERSEQFLEQKNFLTCYWSLVLNNLRIRTNNWDVENYRNKLENIKCDIVCRRVSTMWLQLYIPKISDKAYWSFCGMFV